MNGPREATGLQSPWSVTSIPLIFDFAHGTGDGMSWNAWERLLLERAARAESADGTSVALHTEATMTPYDPSAGGTMPIMHYLKHGWAGTRAKMKARWVGGLGWRAARDKPYRTQAQRIAHFVILGPGAKIPADVRAAIGEDMKEWLIRNFFKGKLTPRQQLEQYREGGGGAYGPGGSANVQVINPWENLGEGDAVKIEIEGDPANAPVHTKRGPGFLASLSIQESKD